MYTLTVLGLESSILRNNEVTPGENQGGEENSAWLICMDAKKPARNHNRNTKTLDKIPNRKSGRLSWNMHAYTLRQQTQTTTLQRKAHKNGYENCRFAI